MLSNSLVDRDLGLRPDTNMELTLWEIPMVLFSLLRRWLTGDERAPVTDEGHVVESDAPLLVHNQATFSGMVK